jgi:hypothetical protein
MVAGSAGVLVQVSASCRHRVPPNAIGETPMAAGETPARPPKPKSAFHDDARSIGLDALIKIFCFIRANSWPFVA